MTSTRRANGFLAVLLLSGASAIVGCGGGKEAAPPPETASTASNTAANDQGAEDEESQGLTEHHQHHHHGGVTLLIALSIETLGVSPEQKAQVEQIRKDLHAKMEPAREAEQNVVSTLADGIAAGGIDKAKVDIAMGRLATASSQLHEATIDAQNQLHAALTPEQRVALAEKVEAHWQVWQSANAEQKAEPGKPMHQHAHLVKEIGLTPDQVDKIHANLAANTAAPQFDPKEVDAHIHAFGEAFKQEKFDAKTLTTGNSASAHLAMFGASRMVRYYEAVDPVLTAEQRAKLAQILKEHASYDPSKGAE